MRPLSFARPTTLRAIAVGIVAVAGLSAVAAAEETPTVLLAGVSTMALITVPPIAQPIGRPRPIPFLPSLTSGAGAVQTDSAAGFTDTLPRRSTILREAVIAGAAIGVGFLLDDSIKPGSGKSTAMYDIGQFIGSPYTPGAGAGVMWIGGAVTHHPRSVGTAKRVLASVAATTVTVALLKVATNRERPDGSNRNSFPSGHSGTSFAAATVLDRTYGLKVGLPAYGLAGFVAASRVVGNRHFFSDVVAGAVIGRFFGRIFTIHH
ncbi:MAG TPA: phosphatase PAP2 family protein [Candidatus Eisenbacteria bacterium]